MRGRKDHYLPQGYLRGFIHPSRRNTDKLLWHYDVQYKKWKQRSAAAVGYEVGFYDPIGTNAQLEIADETFVELENKYSLMIDELAANNFDKWRYHFNFFLHFMQMMRARSPLFFKHNKAYLQSKRVLSIKETAPIDQSESKAKPASLPDAFIKNYSLMQMREEILKGPDQLKDFDWALRWTEDPDNPLITSEQPFTMAAPLRPDGTAMTMFEAFEYEETWLHFPLCWQATLFGSRKRITDPPTERIAPEALINFRKTYFEKAENYVVSPVRLDDEGAPVNFPRSRAT
jgi:hypothetical protein